LIKGMTVISITNPLKHLTHYIHITTWKSTDSTIVLLFWSHNFFCTID
jgi:hypothetical protein